MMPALAPVSALTAIEVLRVQPETPRASAALDAFAVGARRAGIHVTASTRYRAAAPVLVIWGPGAPDRAEAMRRQVARGGHAIALDLAYWTRDQKIRISIDAPHPQGWVMRAPLSVDRLQRDRPVLRDGWNPDGPILLAGIGRKAQVQYGADVVGRWEADMMAACRARWPERRIELRPKSSQLSPPIDQALDGAFLVITWHSNVAVDAIRMGIPVVCKDCAAAAICPSTVPEVIAPLPTAVRDRFLTNLAWFQWRPDEAAECWAFLREVLA